MHDNKLDMVELGKVSDTGRPTPSDEPRGWPLWLCLLLILVSGCSAWTLAVVIAHLLAQVI